MKRTNWLHFCVQPILNLFHFLIHMLLLYIAVFGFCITSLSLVWERKNNKSSNANEDARNTESLVFDFVNANFLNLGVWAKIDQVACP